jgi:TonB family protein
MKLAMLSISSIRMTSCAQVVALPLLLVWCLLAALPAFAEPMVGVLTKSQYESLFTATTQSGTRLSGPSSLKGFGDWLMPRKPDRLRGKRLGCGVFRIHIQPNGTVSRVEVVRSVGDANFDGQIAAMFKKVKARPNTLKEVQIPTYYL